jgi:HAD superfamily hydrolase (TIGR01509 family)
MEQTVAKARNIDKIKLVIFDMDGTLIDSEKVYKRAWKIASHQIGLDLTEETAEDFAGRGIHETFQLLGEMGVSPDMKRKMYDLREIYIHDETALGRVDSKPYAEEVLRALKSQNYLLAMASSSPGKRGREILTSLDLFELFDYSIFGDEVEHQKPSPDAYLEILKAANLASDEALVVEDSLTGITAAREAGIDVIQIPDSSTKAQYEIPVGYVSVVGNDLRVVLDYLEIKG